MDRSPTSASPGSLAALCRHPPWRRWATAATLGRLPVTMEPLALLLAGYHLSGSFAIGAVVSGLSLVTFGVAAPLRGRRLDRRELSGGLRRDLVVAASFGLLQALVLAIEGPVWLLAVAALGSSLAYATVEGSFRALLPLVVERGGLARANAVEAVLGECSFVVAPALVGVMVLTVGPAGLLAAMAGLALLSAASGRRLPRKAAAPSSGLRAPWRVPGARATYTVALVVGAAIGTLEAGLPARLAGLGLDPGFAGLYLSLAYAGSALAGLVVSAVGEGAARATARAVALLLAFAVLLAAVAAVATPWALGAALLVAGAPLAPLSALGTMVLQRAVPAGDHAAAFSMFFAAVAVGAGLGNALAAVLLQSLGPRWLLLGAALLVAAAASVLRARRRT